MSTFFVSIAPKDAAVLIHEEVVDGSITGELIDFYEIEEENSYIAVLVFEKHYSRAGNRLTLTVTIDDLHGKTRVHSVSGGGGEGLLRFDWGAAEDFEAAAENALGNYIIS